MTISLVTPALGNTENKLPVCAKTPNCVSSQASILDKHHYIEPFKLKVDADTAWKTFKEILREQNRIAISHEAHNRLHAEATSLLFRFIDDIDAILDNRASLIHIRSASRVGHHDFGVNRQRLEKLRKKLRQAGVAD